MIKLIAETAWHHEGDFSFMHALVSKICLGSAANIVKMHITLDLDEYMHETHEFYHLLKSRLLSERHWEELIGIVQSSGKELMLLLNDTKAIQFASRFRPSLVELHSVCLNVPGLQETVLDTMDKGTKIVVGVGGCTLQEIDAAIQVFGERDTVLMFGFQNYPTQYKSINLKKIRKIQALYPDKQFGYADHTAWNEPNNELITLLVTANNMSYVEKHVTTTHGQERCDYSAAISIEMLNQLSEKIAILNQVGGNGSLTLNDGEKAYSQYGPMKMAAILKTDKAKQQRLTKEDIRFCRVPQVTQMSQIDVQSVLGRVFKNPMQVDQVIDWECFEE